MEYYLLFSDFGGNLAHKDWFQLHWTICEYVLVRCAVLNQDCSSQKYYTIAIFAISFGSWCFWGTQPRTILFRRQENTI